MFSLVYYGEISLFWTAISSRFKIAVLGFCKFPKWEDDANPRTAQVAINIRSWRRRLVSPAYFLTEIFISRPDLNGNI